jgi:hypothetical protein
MKLLQHHAKYGSIMLDMKSSHQKEVRQHNGMNYMLCGRSYYYDSNKGTVRYKSIDKPSQYASFTMKYILVEVLPGIWLDSRRNVTKDKKDTDYSLESFLPFLTALAKKLESPQTKEHYQQIVDRATPATEIKGKFG